MAALTLQGAAHDQPTLFGLLAGFGLDGAGDESRGKRRHGCQGVIATLRARIYVAAAEIAMSDRCTLADAERLALAELSLRYAAVPSTEQKVTREIARFFKYLRARGVEWLDDVTVEHVDEFVWSASRRHGRYADVSATTAANRQSFLRTLFAMLGDLGVWTNDSVVGDPIRRNDGDSSRPLTDDELHRVHVQAFGGLLIGRTPLLVAFAEAGGDASDIAGITLGDVDVVNGTVHLTGRATRTNRLGAWAHEAVSHVLRNKSVRPNVRLAADPRLSAERAAHSITVRLRHVLRDAGLAGQSGVTPKSIRLTTARTVLVDDGIEAAARFLGNESLDATARALRHHWWEQ